MPDLSALIAGGAANILLLVPIALALGALHALEPGHSKALMSAFIVAIHGTAKQAILLALAVTVGHTIIIWGLAILAWRYQDTEMVAKAEPWLLLVGGLLIVALAVRMLYRLRFGGGHHGHDHHDHDEDDEDAHAAAHAAEVRERVAKGPVTNFDIAWFGFSGGLMPCPAAFAVLLACFHHGAYALGVVMVAAFSVGLAATLVGIGLAAAWGARALASRQGWLDRFARWAPYASAGIVLVMGLAVTAHGISALRSAHA
jgi:nickel/cobalt exporter